MKEPTFEEIERVAKAIFDDDPLWRAMDENDRNAYRHEARRYLLAYLRARRSATNKQIGKTKWA